MGALSPTHWAIIIILVLLLFGSRKLPDMARGVGQSLRIFKAETADLRGEDKTDGQQGATTPAVEQGSSAQQTAAQQTAPQQTPAQTPQTATPQAPGAHTTPQTSNDSSAG